MNDFTLKDSKKYFSQTLEFHKNNLLFQAHSHHPWTDVAYEAMEKYFILVKEKLDFKWNDIFNDYFPRTQNLILEMLNCPAHWEVSVSPSTHDLLVRFISAMETKTKSENRKLSCLVSLSEFHSARRQFQAWQQSDQMIVEWVEVEFSLLKMQVFLEQNPNTVDLVFLSQCLYGSGYFFEETELLKMAGMFPHIYFVIDVYHSFATRPLNFNNAFPNMIFLGGCYKYAMSGENCCFLVLPKKFPFNPTNTGWFAEFGELEKTSALATTRLVFSQDGYRFLGSTFDPLGMIRYVSTWEYFKSQGITLEKIRWHVLELQNELVARVINAKLHWLFPPDDWSTGNFLCLQFKNSEELQIMAKYLETKLVWFDSRGHVIRFGFSIYQDISDVEKLALVLNNY